MFDFSNLYTNSGHPTFIAVIFSLCFALAMSLILTWAYHRTTRYETRPDHFLQSLVLSAIITTIIMQAIGDSIGRGLGMLGALSIIRFRTNFTDTRNLMFLFASIAIGIACGVFSFNVAWMGTLLFSLTAFALYYSPISHPVDHYFVLRIRTDTARNYRPEIETQVSKLVKNHHLKKYKIDSSVKDGNYLEYEYQISLDDEDQLRVFSKEMESRQGIFFVKISQEQSSASL